MQGKLTKDYGAVLKVVDRYHDRYAVRKNKFLRPIQERYAKDKIVRMKLSRENFEKVHAPATAKATARFESEVGGWMQRLVDRIRLGEDAFAKSLDLQHQGKGPTPHGPQPHLHQRIVAPRIVSWLRLEQMSGAGVDDADVCPRASRVMEELLHFFAKND